LIDGLFKKSDVQDLQEKLIDGLLKAMDIQSIRAEQERQGKVIEGLVQKVHKQYLRSLPVNCTDAKFNGIYKIRIPSFSSRSFKVVCDAETQGGGWTIILRRLDGIIDFYRNWTEYKLGFGDRNGEFFLGLDKIHALTAERYQELLVVLEDFEGNEAYEFYDRFAIGDEDQQYVLHTLGKASGTAGDGLNYHRDSKFTTKDRDNDGDMENNCAETCYGAWRYKNCLQRYDEMLIVFKHRFTDWNSYSNLAGHYNSTQIAKGVIWNYFKGSSYSLKRAVMMIRPKK